MFKKRNLIKILFLILLSGTAAAQLRLPHLISDNMVLQRDEKINIWGWANAGGEVLVTFNGKSYKTVANAEKKWQVVLPANKAGVSGDIVISSAGEQVTVHNIIFGDVWVCSGQSNMEFWMGRIAYRQQADIANSANPNIRQFLVKRVYSFTGKDDVDGEWTAANPTTIGSFTAVGYYMARDLYEKYHVPIGILHTSLGGTPIEAWMSEKALQGFDRQLSQLRHYRDTVSVDSIAKRDRRVADNWYRAVKKADKGLDKNEPVWASSADTVGWQSVKVPGFWQLPNLPNITGIVWYKKQINIPASAANKDAWLEMGMIEDQDSTYFNGIRVGATGKYVARYYKIPASLIHAGLNTITIRILNSDGVGGVNPGKIHQFVSGDMAINLDGEWKFKIGARIAALPVGTFTRLNGQPTVLYHAMIEPLFPYKIKGAVWYQGEANSVNLGSTEYRKLLPAMITDWRERWQQGNFPFLVVQLPNFQKKVDNPGPSNWALVREAQLNASHTIPNAATAITIDIGDGGDIHPENKKEVGRRLALAAEKMVYGDRNIVSSGPVYREMKVEGDKITITFDHVGGGLLARDGKPLQQFAIAGADKKYVWANARIENNKIIVWSSNIKEPVAVRYAWADNPEGCNLYNQEGLPASPFRTDSW